MGPTSERETIDLIKAIAIETQHTYGKRRTRVELANKGIEIGGTVVFSEAFWEPLVLLNSIRTLKSLPPLVEHDFNRYLKQASLEEYFRSKCIQYEVIDFSSIYYLGSRFLSELVTNSEDYPGYSNPINELF